MVKILVRRIGQVSRPGLDLAPIRALRVRALPASRNLSKNKETSLATKSC